MDKNCNCTKSFVTTSEYPCKQPACIKNKQPDCLATAVIPAITIETATDITKLANCFVRVVSNNTTYYVDDKHRPMLVWAGSVETESYDTATNPLGLRSQFCYNTTDEASQVWYFDKQGTAHLVTSEEV